MTIPLSKMIGQRFGLFVVICEADRRFNKAGISIRYFRVRCDCGKENIVRGDNLRTNNTRSCGCLERARKHSIPHHKAPGTEYGIWTGMRSRCRNPKCKDYRKYGARGIRVCQRWDKGEGNLSGYECFLADMGRRPSPRHSIDRFPTKSGNYEPSNCRWATPEQQYANRRRINLDHAIALTDLLRMVLDDPTLAADKEWIARAKTALTIIR